MAGPYLSWSCSTADCQLRLSVLYGTMQVHYVKHCNPPYRCVASRLPPPQLTIPTTFMRALTLLMTTTMTRMHAATAAAKQRR